MPAVNRAWIELEKPRDDAHAAEIVEQANNMLRRLAPPKDNMPSFEWACFGWDDRKKQFTWGSPMGVENLVDRGQWLSLTFLGRPLET